MPAPSPRRCALVVILAFALGGAAQAQEGEALRAAAEEQRKRLALLQKDLTQLQARLDATADALEQGRIELARMVEPTPEPEGARYTTSEALEAAARRAERRVTYAERRSSALATLRQLIAARLESLTAALNSLEGARDAAGKLGARIAELRAAQAEPRADDGFPSVAELSALAADLTRQEGLRSNEKRRLEEEVKQLEAEQSKADARLAQLRAARAQLQSELVAQTQREALAQEYQSKDASALAGLLVARALDREKALAKVAAAEQALSDARARVAEAEAALTALAPPDPTKFVGKSRMPRVSELERDLAIKTALRDYTRAQVEAVEALLPRLDAVGEAAQQVSEAAAEATQRISDLEVMRRVIAARVEAGEEALARVPADPDLAVLSADRERLEALRARVLELRDGELKARRASLVKSLADARERLATLKAEIPSVEAALSRESALAVFVREVEKLPNADLISQYQSALAEVTSATAAGATLREGIAARSEAVDEQLAAVLNAEPPLVRRDRAEVAARRKEVVEDLARATGLPVPQRANGESAKPLPARSAAEPTDDPRLEELESRRVFVTARLRYCDEMQAGIEAAQESLTLANEQRQELIATLERALGAARRAFGCAEEAQLRLGAGALNAEQLPASFKELDLRARVLELQARIDEQANKIEIARQRLERFSSGASLFNQRRQDLNNHLRVLDALVSTYRSRSTGLGRARMAFAELNEFEQTVIVDQATRRQQDELPLWSQVLSVLDDDGVKQLGKRLDDLYRDAEDLRRRLELYDSVTEQTSELIKLLRQEAEVIGSFQERVQQELEFASRYEAAERARAVMALAPDKAPEVAADLQKRLGLVMLPPPPAPPDALPRLADDVFLALSTRLALERRLEEVREASSKVGLAEVVGPFEEERARYEAEHRALSDELAQLIGARAASETTGEPQADPGQLRAATDLSGNEDYYNLGKIGVLRRRQREARLRRLQTSMLSLILIPILAFVILVLTRVAAARIIARLRGKPRNEDEELAERRVETLLAVFGTAWKGIVIIVSGIYMLKNLGMDVTPLVASAGIAGMAIVFGAQTLVRDFFTGFFILLEGQYKIGDWIKLEGVEGYVESVSIRLTTLRDVQGDRHFIPNGAIARVTNQTQLFSGQVLDIGVSYKEDPDAVIDCLREVTREMYEDARWGRRFHAPPLIMGLQRFSDSSVDFRISLKTRPGAQWEVTRELRRRIKKRFDQVGIEIPFPQRVVHHKYEAPPPRPAPEPAPAPEPKEAPPPSTEAAPAS